MSDVQIAIIDQENIEVNLAVPGIQGAKGDAGTVAVALDGTAAAPGISFASDTDTGIYRVGANSIGISTGGTGRLFVDVSGRVSINPSATETQTRRFHVRGVGAGDGAVLIKSSSTPDGDARGFLLQAFGASSDAYVWQLENSPLIFGTNATEKARIRADGLFEVKGAGVAGSSPAFSVSGSAPANSLVILPTSGNVGLGITNPLYQLHLGGEGVGSATGRIALGSIASTTSARIDGYRFDGTFAGQLHLYTTTSGGTETRAVTIDQAQRVGIGTTLPDVRTHIVGTALTKSWSADANDFLAIESSSSTAVDIRSGSTAGGNIFFSDGDARARGRIEYSHLADELRFGTAGTYARVVLDSSGRVGIGTNAPGYLLDVRRASAGDVVAFTGSTDGGRPLKFVSADNGIFLGAQWTRDIASGSGIHAWAINGTERARITSDSYLRMAASTGGIQFNGDTAAANALDDYEEGTWTVTFHDAVSGGNQSATTGTGTYTKVGRLVHIQFAINNVSTSGLTAGNQVFFSLPFTGLASPFEEYNGACAIAGSTTASTPMVTHLVSNSGRGYFIVNNAASGTFSGFLVSSLTSGANGFRVSLTYMA